MDPVTTVCEYCNGTRYSDEALRYQYKGKNIVDVLNINLISVFYKNFFKNYIQIMY